MLAETRRLIDPPRRDDPEDMAMREQRDVAIGGAYFGEHVIGAGGDLLRRFTAGAAMMKYRPTRPRRLNLFGRESFVVPVVPFHQVRFNP